MAKLGKRQSRRSRHNRIRARVSGTQERPRLCVFRSLNHMYAQLIDDAAGHTLAAASTLCQEVATDSKDAPKNIAAQKVGSRIGKLALENGIKQVVFDRAGYKYHGRVKALAEAARQAGLKF